MPDYTNIPRPSVSEEVFVHQNWTDGTYTQLIDTKGFKKLLFTTKRDDVGNSAIVTASAGWTSPAFAVDADLGTSAVEVTASSSFLTVDFGTETSRETKIKWALTEGGGGNGTIDYQTSVLPTSGWTTKATHTSPGTFTDTIATHNCRYARMLLTFIDTSSVTGNCYQIFDTGQWSGGDYDLDLEFFSEIDSEWLPLCAQLITADPSANNRQRYVGENNISASTPSGATVLGGGIIIPESSSLVRAKLTSNGGARVGVSVVKVA